MYPDNHPTPGDYARTFVSALVALALFASIAVVLGMTA